MNLDDTHCTMIVKTRDHLAEKNVGDLIPQDQAPRQLDANFFLY